MMRNVPPTDGFSVRSIAKRSPLRDTLPTRWKGISTLLERSSLNNRTFPEDISVLHLHNSLPALELLRLTEIAARRQLPVVITTHGLYEVLHADKAYGINRYLRPLWDLLMVNPLRKALGAASRVHVLSEADRDLVGSVGVNQDQVVVAPNAINPSLSNNVATPRKHQSPRLFFLANHTRNKGIETLLRASEIIEYPCTLVIGGDKREGVNYDVSPAPGVKLEFTGFLSPGRVQEEFSNADIFVFPSRADTFPLVILEAMSSGCAIVASDLPGIRQQVTDHCADLFETGNPQALAASLSNLMRRGEVLEAKKEAALGRATSFVGWDKSAGILLDVYRELLR